MAIAFSGDAGLREDAFSGISNSISKLSEGLTSSYDKLTGKSSNRPPKENVYVDDGFQNVPGTSFAGSGNIGEIDDVKTRRVTTQSPSTTVYIKKKLFWSLRNEHDTKFMNSGEKLFIRASKLLFERKCAQIAAFEAVTKLNEFVDEDSELDVSRIQSMIDLLETNILDENESSRVSFAEAINENPNDIVMANDFMSKIFGTFDIDEKAELVIQELKRIMGDAEQSKQEILTTWVIDKHSNIDRPGVGRGVGVIELTAVDSMNTTLSLKSGDLGSVSVSIQDPYNMMSITNSNIEMALASALRDSTLERSNNDGSFSNFASSPQASLEAARKKDDKLRKIRNDRFGVDGRAEIIFEINTSNPSDPRDQLNPFKVTGRITSLASTFNINNYAIILFQLPVEEQLTIEERDLVVEIFGHLNEYTNRIENISQTKLLFEDELVTGYARRQLRKYYLGKSIVQPMDGIHIYVRGNTIKDSDTIGPLSSMLGASPFVASFKPGKDADGANDAVLKEEMRQFGIKGISIDMYRALRTSSLLRNAGMHIFGGLVTTVTSSYNAERGSYTMQVSGENNMKWLNQSRVNTAPSLLNPQGVLEDPLTPLDIKVNEGTGLIEQTRLSDDNINRPLFYKSGTHRGSLVTDDNVVQDVTNIGSRSYGVRYHAPGMSYKWKEGIIAVSQSQNLRTTLDGSDSEIKKLRRDVGVTIANDPFANLDVADVISLLVTGYPHNYESFFKNAKSIGNFTGGLDNNDSESFFHSFFDIHQSTNKALGNFQPAKDMRVTPDELHNRLKIQSDLINDDKELSSLQSEAAATQDLINSLPESSNNLRGGLKIKLKAIEKKIDTKSSTFKKNIDKASGSGLRIYGNNIVLDGVSESESGKIGGDEKLRSKLMMFRPQISARLNRDSNLFIVSDEYDKDLDLQAFVAELASNEINIWESTYKSPIEICIKAAQVIDFEFFCMAEDTIILSMSHDGDIKSKMIKDFSEGDMVLSIDQNTNSVSWKKTRLSKRMLASDEYMVSVRDGQGSIMNLSNKHKLLDNNMNEIDVSSLKPGMKLATASKIPNIEENTFINTESMFIEHKWYTDFGKTFKIAGQGSGCKHIPKIIPIDEDIAWLFGMYVAEGSVSDPDNRINKKYRGYHTMFSLNYNEIGIANRISQIIDKKFNIKSNIYRYKKYGRCTVDVGSFVFSKIIKSIFGRTSSYNKRVPSIIWKSNSKDKISFISGVIMGDGTYCKGLSLTSKSKYLLNDISQLLLMLGIESRLDTYDKLFIYGKERMSIFSSSLAGWHHHDELIKYCSSNTAIRTRSNSNKESIKSVSIMDYNKPVYDLEVDDYHTFLLGSTWSHNCDTSGNIQLRPPQYNKIPISLLSKMLMLSRDKGIDLMPDFVKTLFSTRQASVKETKKNLVNEAKILSLFIFNNEDGLKINNRGDASSKFASDLLIDEDAFSNTDSVAVDSIEEIVTLKNLLPGNNIEDGSSEFLAIEKEFMELNDPKTPNVNSIRNAKLNRLVQINSKLQIVEETISKLNKPNNEQASGALTEALSSDGTRLNEAQMATILEPFGNLLEDDFNDFLGPGSSKRFIIHDDQIIDYTFTESDSNINTRIDVTGQQSFIGEGKGNIAGIPLFWAGATDFDMWKQYGWKAQTAVNKPFFNNAELQCAPYAMMMLTRQRRDVIRAKITLSGNEYYQLGDVVYINTKDMLYYVYGISHSLSYSGTFKTTLDLRYGHPLGEFIPTPLDVIGKNLIKNQRKFNTTFMSRNTSSANSGGRCVGTIIFKPSGQSDVDMLIGGAGNINLVELKNALLRINSQIERDSFKHVEVRGFIRDSDEKGLVSNRMLTVKNWLTNPEVFSDPRVDSDGNITEVMSSVLDPDEFAPIPVNKFREFDFKNADPILVPMIPKSEPGVKTDLSNIKMDDINIGRSPSEESYNFMRDPNDKESKIHTIEIVIVTKV